LTGLAVVTGRRSITVRSEAVAQLLNEIATDVDPLRPIFRRIKDGTKIPGFGSSYYVDGDPRARFLMGMYEGMFGGEKTFRNLKKAIAAIRTIATWKPDFVFANAYGYLRLGLDARRSLFPLGRSVGWIAHAIEQFEGGEVMRATESYIGPLPE